MPVRRAARSPSLGKDTRRLRNYSRGGVPTTAVQKVGSNHFQSLDQRLERYLRIKNRAGTVAGKQTRKSLAFRPEWSHVDTVILPQFPDFARRSRSETKASLSIIELSESRTWVTTNRGWEVTMEVTILHVMPT